MKRLYKRMAKWIGRSNRGPYAVEVFLLLLAISIGLAAAVVLGIWGLNLLIAGKILLGIGLMIVGLLGTYIMFVEIFSGLGY